MEIGVLGFSGSKNIGDYIQTKAVIDILNTQNIKILDREKLNNYKGNRIKTIVNGWFMESQKIGHLVIIYIHYLYLFILIHL